MNIDDPDYDREDPNEPMQPNISSCSCAYEDARICAMSREHVEPCECGCHMTDDEMMDLIEKTPVPSCAHPRLQFGEEQKDENNWVTVPWSCPDCGKSGAQRFHRARR